MAAKERQKTCDICGGSGQVSYFKGVSRFLLSAEECAACAGTGLQLPGETEEGEGGKPSQAKKRQRRKKK